MFLLPILHAIISTTHYLSPSPLSRMYMLSIPILRIHCASPPSCVSQYISAKKTTKEINAIDITKNVELSDDSTNTKGKRPGRKPITTEATTKRTAQNRAAQRAFRERRQQYLKGLEDKIQELTERQERTERENKKLKGFVDQLKQEN
ncbi:DNA-binding transcription factor yap1, partial [Coemansia sp. RSA 2603]